MFLYQKGDPKNGPNLENLPCEFGLPQGAIVWKADQVGPACMLPRGQEPTPL